MDRPYFVAGCGGLVLLLHPYSVRWLESSMTGYMLVQIPGVVACGYMIGKAFRAYLSSGWMRVNSGGIPGLLIAVFTIVYWILPRSVDAAINEPVVDLFKFGSLVLFAGMPLSCSWPQLNALVRGFVWANLISMLVVMSWLYSSAPVRLCNNFLEQQQELLGRAMLGVGVVLALYKLLPAFIGKPNEHQLQDDRL